MNCANCGHTLALGDWPWCPHVPFHQPPVNCHPSETTVLWEHPGTGEVRYPGRNDHPMPERYRRSGYERREYRSIQDHKRIEKRRGVTSELLNFDRGTGRGF